MEVGRLLVRGPLLIGGAAVFFGEAVGGGVVGLWSLSSVSSSENTSSKDDQSWGWACDAILSSFKGNDSPWVGGVSKMAGQAVVR